MGSSVTYIQSNTHPGTSFFVVDKNNRRVLKS